MFNSPYAFNTMYVSQSNFSYVFAGKVWLAGMKSQLTLWGLAQSIPN